MLSGIFLHHMEQEGLMSRTKAKTELNMNEYKM